ncbi:TPA: ABC transporter ATP-binding protein [Bacillus anthracis]|nr:ABC transporter ATP-binding protein [Bacillus anthracis]
MSKKISNNNSIKIYIWLLSFVKPYFLQLITLIFCSIFIAGVELSIPIVIQKIIDTSIVNKNVKELQTLIILITILVILMFASILIRNLLQKIIQEKTFRDLQSDMFCKLRLLGVSYFESHPVGDTLNFFNSEISAVRQIYSDFPNIIKEIIMVCISILIIIMIHPILGLIIIPCFSLYYLVGPSLDKKNLVLSKKARISRMEYSKKIYESISGLIEVRSNSAEKWDMERVVERQNIFHKVFLKQYFYAVLKGVFRRISSNLGIIVLFIYGSILIRRGELSLGSFVGLLFLYTIIIKGIVNLVNMTTYQKVIISHAENIYEFMMQSPRVIEINTNIRKEGIKGDIVFRNISFGYTEHLKILSKFNLNIKSGQKVGIVGTSGSGKSTLLKLICRFYDPDIGEVLIDGIPVKNIPLEQLRQEIGFVFQENLLFGGSLRENIRFGNLQATDDEIFEAAKAAYIHEYIISLPNGYDTIIGERGDGLSAGQKQRISLARMILKNPSIILLDEATSALDNISEYKVQKALDVLTSNKTIIAVAHRLSTIQHFDYIFVMDQGKIVESGTYDCLIQQQGLFYRIAQGKERKFE